jgi:hypothetical protein
VGLTPIAAAATTSISAARRLAQYRPFEQAGLGLQAVLRDLVLAIAALNGGKIASLPDCRQSFSDCWGLDVEIEEIKPIVEDLITSGQARREGKEIHLSKAHLAALEANSREWDQTEERALREWELAVLQSAPGLAPEELAALREDLL